MRNVHGRSDTGSLLTMPFRSVWCAAFTVVLASCSTGLPVQREGRQAQQDVPAPLHSIVFVIHGDGDYLYHDTRGNVFAADEEALEGAQRVALENPEAEVFIFHRKPLRRLFFVFPLHDGEFSYYRHGRLMAQESYWRDREEPGLDTEVRFYRRFRARDEVQMVRMFFYFGHEIPEWGGSGYDASYPDRSFTVGDLADGLGAFTVGPGRFDLVVLSACHGGTPYTVAALGLFARTIIASPEPLHLSSFDLRALERLDPALREGDVPALAQRFAHRTFHRLTEAVQTVVSIAVFDVDRAQAFLQSVHGTYELTLTALQRGTHASAAMAEHCDCADLPGYVFPGMGEGVEVLYRPSLFGPSKQKRTHSGWECWRERAAQAAR